jgi:hypothetical protein
MKQHRFVLILLAVLAAAGAGLAQSPDFSGEWKLDSARSELGEMAMMNPEISLSVRQEAGVLSLRRTVVVPERTMVKSARYTLDGKECLNAGESLKDLKGTAVLEKGRLVIRSEQEGATMTIQGDNPPQVDYFKYDSVEEWSLSADGKTLTLVQTGQLPDGPRRTTFVFAKTAP